jgi:hypothetical protein
MLNQEDRDQEERRPADVGDVELTGLFTFWSSASARRSVHLRWGKPTFDCAGIRRTALMKTASRFLLAPTHCIYSEPPNGYMF